MLKLKLNREQIKFQKIATSYLFSPYMFFKIPSAFFSGVKVKSMDTKSVKVTVPFKWMSQNPFKSTYFACLAMAAELSTGLPVMWASKGQKPNISMLVVNIESEFIKKADSTTVFTCKDVKAIFKTIEKCRKTKNGETIKVETIGHNSSGEIIAKFWFTWSVKEKSK